MKVSVPYSYATLPSGLRVVHVARRTVAEYFGVAVKTGSRNDPAGLPGLAHFVEHTIFKGTECRRSHHIINRMERIGGELNAYTTKEGTTVYTVYPCGHTARAAELVADLVIRSVFPESELEKEKEVVAEEIDSYLDTPSEAVFDDFEDNVFAGTTLGHNILGSAAALKAMTSQDCRSFLTGHYAADEMVAFYLGPMNPDRLFRLVERYFSDLPTTALSQDVSLQHFQYSPTTIRRDSLNTHQAHTVIGCPIPGMYSESRYAFSLLSNILGGPGMNSLLNIALRERRGLVYTVESSINLYTDCGLFNIYYGCDPVDNDRCSGLIARQLDELAEKPLTERAISMAKRQYLGQLTVSSSSNEQTALSAARSTLFRGKAPDMEQTVRIISALTPADIREAAVTLADKSLRTSLTLG